MLDIGAGTDEASMGRGSGVGEGEGAGWNVEGGTTGTVEVATGPNICSILDTLIVCMPILGAAGSEEGLCETCKGLTSICVCRLAGDAGDVMRGVRNDAGRRATKCIHGIP